MTVFPDRAVLSPIILARLRRIRYLALDMDGTLYQGASLFPWTAPFLALMRDLGIGYTFLTNNPSKSKSDCLTHLGAMGLTISPDEIYTSAEATIEYLRSHKPDVRRIYALGTPSMLAEFSGAGFDLTSEDPSDPPDAVVVGFDMTLVYPRLCRAAWWIRRGKPFVATNPDLLCPTDQPTLLIDCGSICALLEKAAGRAPDVVLGKPDPAMLKGIIDRHHLGCEEIAMVGDRLYTDISMAHRAGILGVLVLTGEATAEQAGNELPPPDLIVPSLADLGTLLEEARQETGGYWTVPVSSDPLG